MKKTANGNGHHQHQERLSSRKSAPLDMSSVERRGQYLGARETPKHIRPHGLAEAPTFRPTEEEFKDPIRYIQSIAEVGRQYGIAKIIPPDSWNPAFAIDTEVRLNYHFFAIIWRQDVEST